MVWLKCEPDPASSLIALSIPLVQSLAVSVSALEQKTIAGADVQVAKWGTLTNKTNELNTNTNYYSKYTPNIFNKIKVGKGIV